MAFLGSSAQLVASEQVSDPGRRTSLMRGPPDEVFEQFVGLRLQPGLLQIEQAFDLIGQLATVAVALALASVDEQGLRQISVGKARNSTRRSEWRKR